MVGYPESTGRRLRVVLSVLVVGVLVAAAVPGVAVADETLTDGGIYWQGQTLTYENGLSSGETVRVFSEPAETIAFEDQADASGVVTIQTENLEGDYRLEDGDGNELASFSIEIASLSVDPSSVAVDNGGSNSLASLTLSSQRAGASVTLASSSLSQSEIGDVFGTTEVGLDGNGEAALTADFTGVDPGTYDVEFDMTDATASTSMEVDVAAVTTTEDGGAEGMSAEQAETLSPAEREDRQAERQRTEDGEGDDRPETPQRGFLTNGEDGPLSNVLNLTFLGFLLSAFGIFYQLMEGR